MNATILSVIRALLAANTPEAQIIATISAMEANAGNGGNAPQAGNGTGRNARSEAQIVGGMQPSVTYQTTRGADAKIEQLTGRSLEVAQYIATHRGATKRQIMTELGHATPGVTMSAIHGLQMRGIVESVAIPGATPPPFVNGAQAQDRAAERPTRGRIPGSRKPAAAAPVQTRRKTAAPRARR